MRSKLLILLVFLFNSCSEFENPGEPLQVLTTNFDDAYLEENYNFDLQVTGGLRPYHFEVEEGTLPEGLQLDDSGRIFGVPTKEGSYEFTIIVSDANLSKTFQKFNLEAIVAPPAQLEIIIPETEMREPFTVRVKVQEARDLQAFRTLLTWDESIFEFVSESLRRTKGDIAILEKLDGGNLQVDIAILGKNVQGEENIFEFSLKPITPNTVQIDAESEFLSTEDKHSFSELTVGYLEYLDEDEYDDTYEDDDDLEYDTDEFDDLE